MSLDRGLLPDPIAYFEGEGLSLTGQGKWRTTRCDFHGGSDSMRVNVDSGAWRCMACLVKGGDVLGFQMHRYGEEFEQAARALGAWIEDARPRFPNDRPRSLSPRSAMELVAFEVTLTMVVISDVRRGQLPSDPDWSRFLESVRRIEQIASEYRK